MRWVGHAARIEERCIQIFLRKPEGKRQFGRPGREWETNIKIYFKEIVWKGVDWINVAQDRKKWRDILKTVMNFRVAKNAGNVLTM
jgi:hypothetical protein